MFMQRQKKPKRNFGVFIRNLPYDVSNEDLKAFLDQNLGKGAAGKCVIIKEKDTQESKGFGFAYFKLEVDQKRCIAQLNGKEWKGRKLKIEESKEEGYKHPAAEAKKKQQQKTIMVRGLTFKKKLKATEETLRKTFSKFGAVKNVRIPADKKDKEKHCGYAFVEFKKAKSAEAAVAGMNGKELDGMEIVVDLKLPREEYIKKREEVLSKLKEVEQEEPGVAKQEESESEDESEDEQEEEEEQDEEDDEEDSEENDVQSIEQDEEEIEKDEQSSEEQEEEYDEEEEQESTPKEKLKRDTSEGKLLAAALIQLDLSRTLFIKNLAFDVEEKDLISLFSKYGDVQYAAIVRQKQTGQPTGTAFVKFKYKNGMDAFVEAAEKSARLAALGKIPDKNEKKAEMPSLQTGQEVDGLELGGKKLIVMKAIAREQATKKKMEQQKKDQDPRNLHLLKEGMITNNSPEAAKLSREHLQKLKENYRVKKQKLKNPNVSVSRTRLCVLNLDKKATEKDLKDLFYTMAFEHGRQYGKPKIKQVKVVREKDETARSKGFAFVQFEKHEHALIALRKINCNVKLHGKLLSVEFALDDARKLQKLKRSMEIGALKDKSKLKNAFHRIYDKSKFKKSKKETDKQLGKRKRENEKSRKVKRSKTK